MTYKIDFDKKCISGYCDDKEEIKQMIYKTLCTERYKYPIYHRRYGVEIAELFGMPSNYVCAVIGRRIKEALMQDSRISDVKSFEFDIQRNGVGVRFVADTVFGGVEEEIVV
jgi:hypothetical protein